MNEVSQESKADPTIALEGVIHELPKIPEYANESLNQIIKLYADQAMQLLEQALLKDKKEIAVATIQELIQYIDNTKLEWQLRAERIREIIEQINQNYQETNRSVLEKQLDDLGPLPLEEQVASLIGISYLLKSKIKEFSKIN